jgi:undecaprenyl-diphosphatase
MIDIIAWLITLDQTLFIFINSSLANPITDFLMPIITRDLYLKTVYGIGLIIILIKGDKKLRWSVLFSLLVLLISDQISSSLLKPLFERVRPCHAMDVHLLTWCGSGFSLPSSHAANLFGQAFFFKDTLSKSARYLIPFSIIVALSRVFVGVHYPFDILVGAALGTLVGFGMASVFRIIVDKYIVIKDAGKNVS